MSSIYTGSEGRDIAMIKAALLEKCRVEIDFEESKKVGDDKKFDNSTITEEDFVADPGIRSDDLSPPPQKDIHKLGLDMYRYQFIIIDLPSVALSPLKMDVKVWCVMCHGVKTDPLRILSTSKTMEKFDDYLRKTYSVKEPKPNIYGFMPMPTHTLTIKDIKIYPYDWYPCFENSSDHRSTSTSKSKLENVKKLLPKIKARSEIIEKEDIERQMVEEAETIKNNEQARLMAELMFSKFNPSRPPGHVNSIPPQLIVNPGIQNRIKLPFGNEKK
jgi:hypothetical protein